MDELIGLIRNAPLERLQDAGYLENELLPALGLHVDDPLLPRRLHRYGGGLCSWQAAAC